MNDTVICPRIIWKVDLSLPTSFSKSYCKSVHILKSCWRLVLEKDEEWDEYKIYMKPENPEFYLNVRFFVQCGIRDTFGICRFERFQTTSTENLLNCCIWGASRKLILDEKLIQNNLLWVICTVEPESSWQDCQNLTNSTAHASSFSSTSSKDDLVCDFKYLFKYAMHHDVILECENEIIKAHKGVLACRSRMFEGMFRSNTKEALEGKVVIRDTTFPVFEKIIRFVYTSEINLQNVNFACEIYAEADKYFIISLKEKCIGFFKAHLCASCPENQLERRVSDACTILRLADQHADITLQCWIEDYLSDSALLSTKEWKNFADNDPKAAVEVYLKFMKKIKLVNTF